MYYKRFLIFILVPTLFSCRTIFICVPWLPILYSRFDVSGFLQASPQKLCSISPISILTSMDWNKASSRRGIGARQNQPCIICSDLQLHTNEPMKLYCREGNCDFNLSSTVGYTWHLKSCFVTSLFDLRFIHHLFLSIKSLYIPESLIQTFNYICSSIFVHKSRKFLNLEVQIKRKIRTACIFTG